MRSLPGHQKIQVEVSSLDEPSLVFKLDYLSSARKCGQQVLIERFNPAEQILIAAGKSLTSEGVKDVRRRGLVLAISEKPFPHGITVTLLEPCSHIFWSHSHTDDQLN
jgi:hypothetical protein